MEMEEQGSASAREGGSARRLREGEIGGGLMSWGIMISFWELVL